MVWLARPTSFSEPMLEHLSDTALMERSARGDSRAFRLLLNRHLPRARAIAWRTLVSREDAEEALQDAFGKIWMHAARYDPAKAAFTTWFYRIVVNACMDRARRTPPRHAVLEDTVADGAISAELQLIGDERGTRVRVAVQALPPRQRIAIVLCYFEGMTNPEAAAAMQMHVKALEGLLVRARKTLRSQLEE